MRRIIDCVAALGFMAVSGLPFHQHAFADSSEAQGFINRINMTVHLVNVNDEEVRQAEPFREAWLRFGVNNDTDEPITFFEFFPLASIELSGKVVLARDGTEVPISPTEYGEFAKGRNQKMLYAAYASGMKDYSIAPGEKLIRYIPLNRYIDLSMRGNYHIAVHAELYRGQDLYTLVSDPVVVRVRSDWVDPTSLPAPDAD